MRKAEIIFAIGLLVVGVLIGKYINWPYFKMSPDINFGDVLSIGASFVLVYIVAKILEKGNEERRIEKNMILERIEDLVKNSHQVISTIRAGSIDNTLAISQFKIFHLNGKKIFKLIAKIKINISEQEKQKVFSSMRRLKDLATSSPRQSIGNPSIEIRSNNIFYSSGRIAEIETEWDKLDDLLFDIQTKVNKG
jgi:hypothetical protein